MNIVVKVRSRVGNWVRLQPFRMNSSSSTRVFLSNIGNESVTKIIINNTTIIFSWSEIGILVISSHIRFWVLFDKIDFVCFSWKYIYILAFEMASPGNPHCVNCIGTLSFPVLAACLWRLDSSSRCFFQSAESNAQLLTLWLLQCSRVGLRILHPVQISKTWLFTFHWNDADVSKSCKKSLAKV